MALGDFFFFYPFGELISSKLGSRREYARWVEVASLHSAGTHVPWHREQNLPDRNVSVCARKSIYIELKIKVIYLLSEKIVISKEKEIGIISSVTVSTLVTSLSPARAHIRTPAGEASG